MKTETVSFPSNGATGSGYVAAPDDGAQHPGVVVIQEWWGLEEHIKDMARRFADAGFVAIAPDLYHGQVTAEPDEARKLAMGMQREQAAKDMTGAINYLISRADVAPKKVGMIGFCMGGGLTIQMALHHNEHLGAVAPFYGGGLPGEEDAARINVPIFAAFGEKDDGIPLDKVQAFARGLDRSPSPEHVVQVYPDAPHAFCNDTRPAYRPEAAADALGRAMSLFSRTLV
jgi:carboxymethylenebutenolidase